MNTNIDKNKSKKSESQHTTLNADNKEEMDASLEYNSADKMKTKKKKYRGYLRNLMNNSDRF